jgi:hypothetical protein
MTGRIRPIAQPDHVRLDIQDPATVTAQGVFPLRQFDKNPDGHARITHP